MKRVPSNRMPRYVSCSGRYIGPVMVLLWIGIVAYLSWPWFLVVLAIVCAGYILESHFDRRRQAKIAADRDGKSLCTFVRSLDFRNIDTWIIRAVYEAIEPEVKFPIYKSDSFKFLKFDAEIVDYFAEEVAQRTGRPLTNCELNPRYGKVETVADMIEFFMHQPKSGPASQ